MTHVTKGLFCMLFGRHSGRYRPPVIPVGMAGAAAVRVLYAHLPLRSWIRYRIVV